MNHLYDEVLNIGRTPARAEVLLELTAMLYETGYEDTLEEIEAIVSVNETIDAVVAPTEALICKCASSLLSKIGAPITPETVNSHPAEVLIVLRSILIDIEAFDDFDSLLVILASGELPDDIICNLIAFMTGTSYYDYSELFELVEPRLINIITNTLQAKQTLETRELAAEGIPAATRVAAFMLKYPTDDVANTIGNGGYLNTVDQLIETVDIEKDISVRYDSKIAAVVAAIAIAKFETSAIANDNISYIATAIVGDDTYPGLLDIYKQAGVMINATFELVEGNDEQD